MGPPSLASVCVFCASSPGREGRYLAAARNFGALLASSGRRLVYGGGRVGLMGALADGALAAGGTVVGVIPDMMVGRELAHGELSELQVVGSMHERKATMADLADGFVALPGGIGTLEELFEVWTWGQLGLHDKPCGLLDVDGYFGGLLAFLDHAGEAGFVGEETRHRLLVDRDPTRLLAAMADRPRQSPLLPIDRERT